MSSSSSSAPTAKKAYRFGDYLLKPAAKLLHQVASATAVPVLTSLTTLTNSSPEDPYYVGKLIEQVTDQVASATGAAVVPVLTSLTNSSPEDPYYVGKLIDQIASGVYETVLKSNKLSITAYKNLVDTRSLEYIMIINRPYAANTYIRMMCRQSMFVYVDYKSFRIPNIVDNEITTTVYEDPVFNTKESPHYAAAMIIGDRMLAIVWVDKMRYFVDTSSRYSLEHAVYCACTTPNPVSSTYMTITRI